MANTIKLKSSSVPGKVPVQDSLVFGELALNYSDGKLYYKSSDNQILAFRANIASVAHSELGSLLADDHPQYVHTDIDRTVTAKHTFNPTSPGPAYELGINAQNQVILGLNADLLDGKHGTEFYSSTNKPVQIESYEFSDSLVWIVEHNRNTTKFVETLTDSDGNRFFAKVNIIDENVFAVLLTSASSGTIDVLFVN